MWMRKTEKWPERTERTRKYLRGLEDVKNGQRGYLENGLEGPENGPRGLEREALALNFEASSTPVLVF